MRSVLGSAVFVQSIGMLWIEFAIRPDHFRESMIAEMQRFYRLFYNVEKTHSYFESLLG